MEKKTKKKIILGGLGTAAAGILGYFGWQWWQGRKEKKQQQAEETASSGGNSAYLPDSTSSDTSSHKSNYLPAPRQSGNNDFPLRKGSKGGHVKALQQALIAKYGATILPHYGADGDFGNEVAAALKKKGLPSEIDESTYNVIVGSATDYKQLADTLYNAVENTDLPSALSALRQMKTTDDYSAVNKIFETHTIGFVSKTLVNGLLDAFSDDSQKQQIRLEFTRMGLKYDGSKWSLSGIDRESIITTRATEISEKNGKTIQVPPNIVLGFIVSSENGWTYFFPNNAQIMMRVKSDSIKIYKPN